ncbi:ubiquitin carboxyl-terminal hydrolase 38 [Gigaspora margarita]|uniref:Ubiquitin carboxyl-terminal hydrolase n=1 Tax=Gigaspora margarita TaxID=4874 RepID=A0A8H4A1W5_GIGMA|nr:ubiquitin carboxyl-terminal hydrolase 38 [Gigaspora margarita]
MEQIISALLASNHPEILKKKLVEKLTTKTQEMPQSDWEKLCDFSYGLLLEHETRVHAEVGEYVLSWIAHTQKQIYLKYFNSDALEFNLEKAGSNVLEIYKVLRATTKVIKYKNEIVDSQYIENVENDCQLLQRYAEKYFVQWKGRHDLHTLFISMFYDLPKSIPSDRNVVIQVLIHGLSNVPNESIDNDYREYVEKSVYLIESMWKESVELIHFAIREIFIRLSAAKSHSFAMALLISRIPLDHLSVISPYIQKNFREDISRFGLSIGHMIEMMPHPFAKNIGYWIVGLMKALETVRSHEILISITRINIRKVFKYLWDRKSREDALLVVKYMLLGYQIAPDVFQQVTPMYPEVLDIISQEGDQIDVLHELSNIAQCLMCRFSASQNQFIPLKQKLENLEMPSLGQSEIRTILQEHNWNKNIKSAETTYKPTVKPTRSRKRIGLQNLGNTCFMNSVLQALFNSMEFRYRIFHATSNKSKTSTLHQLKLCFGFMAFSTKSYFSPSALLETFPRWINNGRQQDCHEFLKILFSQIEEESNQFVSNKRPRLDMESQSISRINFNEMPISTFGGTLENTIKCLSCGNKSRTKEDFHDLTLSLKVENESNKPSLDDMLCEFFTPEELNEDNQYFCDKCNGLQDAVKTTRIIVPPRYLILSLNRFEYDKRYARRIKIMTPVMLQDTLSLTYVPDTLERSSKNESNYTNVEIHHQMNGIADLKINGNGNIHYDTDSDMDSEMNNDTNIIDNCDFEEIIGDNVEYDLSAIVVHSGMSAEYGHYYTYAKDEEDGNWYNLNDNFVMTSTLSKIIEEGEDYKSDTPYLLFFRQKNLNNDDLGEIPQSLIQTVRKSDNQGYSDGGFSFYDSENKENEDDSELKDKPALDFNNRFVS